MVGGVPLMTTNITQGFPAELGKHTPHGTFITGLLRNMIHTNFVIMLLTLWALGNFPHTLTTFLHLPLPTCPKKIKLLQVLASSLSKL